MSVRHVGRFSGWATKYASRLHLEIFTSKILREGPSPGTPGASHELPLRDALQAAMRRAQDTLVFCLATERAYYENHEGERFVVAPPTFTR